MSTRKSRCNETASENNSLVLYVYHCKECQTVTRNVCDSHKGTGIIIPINMIGCSVTKNNGYINAQKNTFCLGDHFENVNLTKCEFKVFRYLLMGKRSEEIAFSLSRSVKTIESHIKNIANKLQCSHKLEIIPTAIKYGFTHVLDDINI